MTVTDPISYEPPVKAIRRRGRFLVGALAGLFALAYCVWLFGYSMRSDLVFGRLLSQDNSLLAVCSTAAAALVTPWMWDQLVQLKSAFSWRLTVLAGVLAIPVSASVALAAFFVVAEIIVLNFTPGSKEGFPGPLSYGLHPVLALPLHLLFLGVTPFFGALIGALVGSISAVFALPLSIAACLVGTAWARRRLRDAALASYGFSEWKEPP